MKLHVRLPNNNSNSLLICYMYSIFSLLLGALSLTISLSPALLLHVCSSYILSFALCWLAGCHIAAMSNCVLHVLIQLRRTYIRLLYVRRYLHTYIHTYLHTTLYVWCNERKIVDKLLKQHKKNTQTPGKEKCHYYIYFISLSN